MTERMTLVQARVPEDTARQVDHDSRVLGLANRSEAVREGLRLLHSKAREAALARDYDSFYGANTNAPLTDVAELGDLIAVETMTDERLGK